MLLKFNLKAVTRKIIKLDCCNLVIIPLHFLNIDFIAVFQLYFSLSLPLIKHYAAIYSSAKLRVVMIIIIH